MSNLITVPTESWDAAAEIQVDKLLREYDETCMPVPSMDSSPHLLLSKVRKHYMDYLIKQLSINYENNQKLVNKNIYLPSAIWRCAKDIELSAARSCMVVQIYRKNIVNVINELKNDTKKAKLNKTLYKCLHRPSENDKKLQTSITEVKGCNCDCSCNRRKKLKTNSRTKRGSFLDDSEDYQEKPNEWINNAVTINTSFVQNTKELVPNECALNENTDLQSQIKLQESNDDDLMNQLKQLFHEDPNDDDIFEGTLYNSLDLDTNENNVTKQNTVANIPDISHSQNVILAHEAQIKSLEAKLVSLAGKLETSTESSRQAKPAENVKQKPSSSKWLCEEYFLKTKLYEMMDQIRENNRRKHERIKTVLMELFGDDSDDEGVVSPLEETTDFILSCKGRIAPWVVKLLTPYYTTRIRGKAVFKSLAKHLIRLIYQCSRYPEEYEVTSFVSDFLANHKVIRSEADFIEFKIQNI